MFHRLILTLLLAAFALPASAASGCHEAPAVVTMPASHHSTPAAPAQQDKAVVAHLCIGCIPPSTLASGVDIARLLPPLPLHAPGDVRFDPGPAAAPGTPPPRQEA